MKKFAVNLGNFLINHEFPSFWCPGKERSSQTIEIPKEFLMFLRGGAEPLNPGKTKEVLREQLISCDFNGKAK